MHIVTTHKGTDFDALASVMAANLLHPDILTVLPGSLNPNVRVFLSLHRNLFGFCAAGDIRLKDVRKLTVVVINRWARLERLNALKEGALVSMVCARLTANSRAVVRIKWVLSHDFIDPANSFVIHTIFMLCLKTAYRK